MFDLIREDPFIDKKSLPFFIRPLIGEKNRERRERDPHRHTYHEIIYFKSGEALQNIDDKLVNLKTENTFYLIGLGQIHDFIKGKNMKGYLIRFDNELIHFQKESKNLSFTSILNNISKINTIVLDKKDISSFENLLEQLHQEYSTPVDSYGRRNIIIYLLFSLLIKLQRKHNELVEYVQDLEQSHENKMYFKFIELLEINLAKHHDVDFYAKKLGISNRKLSDITMLVKGIPCKKMIVDRLIIAAKRLLLYSHISSKEISYTLGFESPSYFSRLFKTKTGQSPNSYKVGVNNSENSFFNKK